MDARKTSLALLVLAALATPLAMADKLDEIEAKFREAIGKLGAYEADMTLKSNMNMSGMSITQDMTGHMLNVFKEGKTLSRSTMQGSQVMNMGGNEQKMEMKMLSVSDGEIAYVDTEQMGQRTVIKTKAENADQYGGRNFFEEMKKTHNLSIGDDVEVDGKPCWTVIATPKEPTGQPGAPEKMHFNIWQEHGVVLKMMGLDENDKEVLTMTVSNVNLNPTVDPKQFEFEVPEGVQVMDMTNMGG